MSDERCCCGRIKDFDSPVILNDIKHELLGPDGNFCGPLLHHDLHDLRNENEMLKDTMAERTVGKMCAKIKRLELMLSGEHELLSVSEGKVETLKAEIARVKESWDKTAWENTSLIQKKGELEEELAVNDKLLNARNEVLDEIPECPDHGKQCMPHCSEWIRKAKEDLR